MRLSNNSNKKIVKISIDLQTIIIVEIDYSII